MKRNPMTLDEHRRLGAELHAIRNRLQRIGIDLANRYGKTRPLGRRAVRMSDAVDAVRAKLDGQLHRDHARDFDTHVYYPGPGEEQQDHGQ